MLKPHYRIDSYEDYLSVAGIVVEIDPFALASGVVITLSLAALLISYRWLFPRQTATAKRLATLLWAVQTLVILAGMQSVHSNTYVLRLFRIIGENSLGVAFSGAQLALVAVIALLTAWFARGRSHWLRFYLAAFGLLFFFLASEELDVTRLWLEHSIHDYTPIGVIIVAATFLVALRSPRRMSIWYACLSFGLALAAAGGRVIDRMWDAPMCETLGLAYIDTIVERDFCLIGYIEESFELVGVWMVLVAMLGLLSDEVARPKRSLRWTLYVLPIVAFVLCVAISDPDLGQVQRKIQASPADLKFESGLQVYGYQIERAPDQNSLEVSLWLSALPFGYSELGYSVHLVDPSSSTSFSSRDKFVSLSGSRVRGPWHLPVFRQSLQLETATDIQRNHAFFVVLSVWREAGDKFVRQRVVSSDHRLLSDSQVVLGEVVLPRGRAAYAFSPLADFDNAIALGTVDLPAQARPGDTLSITFNWRAEQAVTEDYVQFLHFGNEETGEWWVYDSPPLGARLPSRLWYSGLADFETWEIPLPADLAPGRYLVFTGLYSTSDLERLPATDADGAPHPDARIPLGAIHIEQA